MKRVFNYEKWKNDPLHVKCKEIFTSFEEEFELADKEMKELDGKEVDIESLTTGYIGDKHINIKWTDEVETITDYLTFLVYGFSIYGLACFIYQLKELILNVI